MTVRSLVAAETSLITGAQGPVLLDEWQRLPQVWDVVRRQVDRSPGEPSFLLSGSATPTGEPTHSGAGRIITLRMRPLSLYERQLTDQHISLSTLLSGTKPAMTGTSGVSLQGYVREIVASGFPAIRSASPRVRDALLDGYLQRIVEHDFPDQGLMVRRPDALLAWLRAYAAVTSTSTAYTRILDAATPGEAEKPARSTTESFRTVLAQLWILDPLPAWTPTETPLKRLGRSPSHHLADPALAARLLGVTEESLLRGEEGGPRSLRDGQQLGRLFESLVVQSVRVYAQAVDARVSFLRTSRGDHEVDIIVERRDGRVVAIEVKLASVPSEDDLAHLKWLEREIGEDLLDAVVITTGPYAYRRPDGIAVVPAAMLGP
jgi:predicted AAA+ superfamily ATPase